MPRAVSQGEEVIGTAGAAMGRLAHDGAGTHASVGNARSSEACACKSPSSFSEATAAPDAPYGRFLLEATDADVVVAGPSAAKAEALATVLNREHRGRRASPVVADASDARQLAGVFADAGFVVDATPSIMTQVQTIAKAAIAAQVDCLDIHFDQKIFPALEELEPRIAAAGRCFITQAGFHPGLPSAFIRYGASFFDTCEKAFIGIAMNQKIETAELIYEIVDLLADDKVDVFEGGAWKSTSSFASRTFDFGARFGRRSCYPISLEELRAMPAMFGLQDVGAYVAGFNGLVDNVLFPLGYALFKIRPGLGRDTIARLFVWAVNALSGPRPGVSFVLEAAGGKAGRRQTLRVVAEHDDVYAFTAIPVVACIRQYLQGGLAKPGLWMMGQVVDPALLIADMARMGVEIRTRAA